MANDHWKFTWPSASILAQFIVSNRVLFENSCIVELGAGCTGLVGLAAAKIQAKRVIVTEYPGNREALIILQENVDSVRPELDQSQSLEVAGIDWFTSIASTSTGEGDVRAFVSSLEHCDYIVASDVFYEPKLFRPLVKTISIFIEKFPKLRVYFSYHLRDENYSIENLLHLENLDCSLVRTVDCENTVQIGIIYKKENRAMHAGIEGGATHSKLVFVSESGEHGEEIAGPGTNMYLNGLEVTANFIADWVRKNAVTHNILLPLNSLGMGLSGAEDEEMNLKFVQYLTEHYGDIAKYFFLSSDSICTIQAAFEEEGVVIIAGTGSSVRLLSKDGSTQGVGGWGHMVGDGGSGFWITHRAIQTLFDDEDGLSKACGDTSVLKTALLEFFNIRDKVGILSHLYSNFEKGKVAAFTSVLASLGEDPVIANIFFEAGNILGKHLSALSGKMNESLLNCCNVVVVGSVFKSWNLLKKGFETSLKGSELKRVCLFKCDESLAVGAALLSARHSGSTIAVKRKTVQFDEISL